MIEIQNPRTPKKMPRLIGLSGHKRSGKTTAASEFIRDNEDFVEYAFADPMKDGLMAIFGFSHDQLHGNSKETIDPRWGVSPRYIMKVFGTEVFREHMVKYVPSLADESIWIKRFRQFYDMNREKNIIVTDVRFPDEAATIRSLGGTIVRIKRDTDIPTDTHASERILFDPDITIENNGTKEDLRKAMKKELYMSRKRKSSSSSSGDSGPKVSRLH